MTAFSQLSRPERAELWACLALRHARGIGPSTAKKLVDRFDSPLTAVEAGLKGGWLSTGIVSEQTAGEFRAEKWREFALKDWNVTAKSDPGILLWTFSEYPDLLREIPDPPLLLYYRGDLSLLRNPSVAIVGARDCTSEGMAVCAFVARGISKAGVTTVSGLAKGIDRVAHLSGLEGPGRSIAVLGTGIDQTYPPCNADLAALLAQKGLVISEFAPGIPAVARHFPVRNRIISGLTRGILVVEAAARSGSLITARLATEQNREVFAVPGSPTAPVSEGCRELIRRGAKPVFNADDILTELATLLQADARKALEHRRSAKVPPQPRTAKDAHKALHIDMQADAVTLLPEGSLPWDAPEPVQAPNTAKPGGRHAQGSTHHAGRKKDAPPVPGNDTPILSGNNEPPVLPGSGAPSALPDSNAPIAFDNGASHAPSRALSEEERRVLAALGGAPVHIDALALSLDMAVTDLSNLLLMMEMHGIVRCRPGMYYETLVAV